MENGFYPWQQIGGSDTKGQAASGPLVLTQNGFEPVTQEKHGAEALKAAEAAFSFDGYQVVRPEFFAHKFNPSMTIKGNSVVFNSACISRLSGVVYVHFMINPAAKKLAVVPCNEDATDGQRWCIQKEEKRKSRQITCDLFAAMLYEFMGWERHYRYKLLGTRTEYKGEPLFVFDLTSTEVYLPQTKDPVTGEKPKRQPPMYPEKWRDSFGIPYYEHKAASEIDLMEGYGVVDMNDPSVNEGLNGGIGK